jgi:hypothetical protein
MGGQEKEKKQVFEEKDKGAVAHVANPLFIFMNPLSLIIHTPGTLDNDIFDPTCSPGVILNRMVNRGISVSSFIANLPLPSAKTAMDIHHTLSNEAVNQGLHEIVKDLRQVERSLKTPSKILLKLILSIVIRYALRSLKELLNLKSY